MRMELKKEVQDLAERFAADLVSVIGSASMSQVAGIVGEIRPASRAVTPTNGHGKAVAKANGNGHAKPGSRDRRSAVEMEKLRRGILTTLAGSKEPLKTGAIAKTLGETKPQSMSFSMRQLVQGKLIRQSGERAKACYTILAAGKTALKAKPATSK